MQLEPPILAPIFPSISYSRKLDARHKRDLTGTIYRTDMHVNINTYLHDITSHKRTWPVTFQCYSLFFARTLHQPIAL